MTIALMYERSKRVAPQPRDRNDIDLMFTGRRSTQNRDAVEMLIDRQYDGLEGISFFFNTSMCVLRGYLYVDQKLTAAFKRG
jgi:hypothetical protein